MQLWDALAQENYPIFVMGASNMPESLDPAIQRRFERSFLIGIPNNQDRLKVLQILLKGSKLDNSFDFEYLSSLTEGYTPSDLLSLCKAAVQMAQRDALTQNLEASSSLKSFNKTAGQLEINNTTNTIPPSSSSVSPFNFILKIKVRLYIYILFIIFIIFIILIKHKCDYK